MSIMTYRQALHDTLRSEMLRDENVFLMGEEIGLFEGAYKITAGMLDALTGTLEGGRPVLSASIGCWVGESEVADVLRETERAHAGECGAAPVGHGLDFRIDLF